jgi:hypothetical protein
MNRRNFLKASAAAAVAARANALPSIPRQFPAVPTLSSLASIRMPHTFMEQFNLPISMNDWGYAQTVKSVSAITAMAFPPDVCCGVPETPWSPGLLNTCELILNDRLAAISNDPAQAVTYQWFPHCVMRKQTVDGIRLRTKSCGSFSPNVRSRCFPGQKSDTHRGARPQTAQGHRAPSPPSAPETPFTLWAYFIPRRRAPYPPIDNPAR